MGISERKEREKVELRELILLKAKEMFLKHGYEKLSIRQIATAVEYSPATIYLYFQDKDEIMHELMNMGFGLMGKELTEAMQEPDAVRRIHIIGRGYLMFGLKNPDWYELMFHSEKPIKHLERCDQDWGHGLGLFDFLLSSCQEAINTGRCKAKNAELLALQLWSLVHGLVSLSLAQRLQIVCHGEDDLIMKVLDTSVDTLFE
ncbi:MAG: TetR/AcrR family transcriptional regulator [Saprospiraceae bacterium]|nr:TetR/AcrR family transcriptional regulator [Saprospiraceae bacterium]MBK7811172.1 TetR/AcrR family transcriptional regulator [Saprospiraceae bacterium]MBK9631123.1 TetR/AcrR family transcriptional regulator [Saprospiraceae bacterium]